MIAEREGEELRLLSPQVGTFTCALPAGHTLVPGQLAGTLHVLGKAFALRVPPDASGIICSAAPERVHAPTGFRDRLYELRPIGEMEALREREEADAEAAGGLHLRSPQTGRFYHRPSPDRPAFAAEGKVLEPGMPVGMIEVMKTFTHVTYQPEDRLPQRARVVRLLVGDGAEVEEGEPLVEVEAAP